MMKRLCVLVTVVVAFFSVDSRADKRRDERELHRLPATFCAAWARHDGHDLAKMMADDVDFVTVGATWLHGRRDFEKYHTRLLSGRFKESANTPLKIAVRFLTPRSALVHWSWSIQGDRNADGSMRPQRFGLMTMLAEKRAGIWQVVAAQNTNGAPSAPPEGEGIVSPIAIPGQQ